MSNKVSPIACPIIRNSLINQFFDGRQEGVFAIALRKVDGEDFEKDEIDKVFFRGVFEGIWSDLGVLAQRLNHLFLHVGEDAVALFDAFLFRYVAKGQSVKGEKARIELLAIIHGLEKVAEKRDEVVFSERIALLVKDVVPDRTDAFKQERFFGREVVVERAQSDVEVFGDMTHRDCA